MTVLSLVFLRVGQRASREQVASLDGTRAALLAEAGISEAIEALRCGKSGNLGSEADPAYLGGGVLWVVATDLGSGRTQLDSMGMRGSGRAAVRIVVNAGAGEDEDGADGGGDGFMGMLFSNKAMQLSQGVTIDSYDSTLGTYASQATHSYGGTTYAGSEGTAAASNGTIQLHDLVKVFGDVHCGPNLTPSISGSAYVSGDKTPSSTTIPLKAIPVPVLASSGVYSVANSATKTINPGKYHFTNLTQGKFSKLKIVGPATVVLDGYTTGASATLQLDCSGGPITIYDTGVWSVDKNYVVGPIAGTELDAAFLISSFGTVDFDQGSKLQVGFYAPNATIHVNQGAEVWGGLVADQINVDQTTKFHFDVNLRHFTLPWEIPDPVAEGATGVQILSWSKIEFPVSAYRTDRRDPFALLGTPKSELRKPAEAWEEPAQ
jgi:hypothetical protein